MQETRPQTSMGKLWNSIQSWLFPVLEDELGVLDEKHRQFVAVCELCTPQDHMDAYRWIGNGCPPSNRVSLCYLPNLPGRHRHPCPREGRRQIQGAPQAQAQQARPPTKG